MKGSTGVTDNDWSNKGLRRRAQGAKHKAGGSSKLIAQSKNRSQGSRGKEGQSDKKIEANIARRSDLIGQR